VRLALLFWLGSLSVAQAFIPPVPWIVREAYEGRKPRRATEVVLYHRIDGTQFEERILVQAGRYQFLWRVGNNPVAGTWDRQGYGLGQEIISGRTSIPLKYLTGNSPEELLSSLVAEGFVSREQLSTYTPGFTGDGDPATWDLTTNYLRHPGIYFQPLQSGIGIAIVGGEEAGGAKTVVFDATSKGMRRLEWRLGNVAAWDFDALGTVGKEGLYPRRMKLDLAGVELINSDLVTVRAPTDAQIREFQAAFRKAKSEDPSSSSLSLLRQLLSNR